MYQIKIFVYVEDANKWLKENPDIEIAELQYFQQHGSTRISILYKPFMPDKRNYRGCYDEK